MRKGLFSVARLRLPSVPVQQFRWASSATAAAEEPPVAAGASGETIRDLLARSNEGAGGGSKKDKVIKERPSSLNLKWVRELIVRTLLQNFRASSAQQESLLLKRQQSLSALWHIQTKPLDQASHDILMRQLGMYCLGENRIDLDVFEELHGVFAAFGFNNLEDPLELRRLLERVQYVKPGDNLRRIVFRYQMVLAPEAAAHASAYGNQIETDPYDRIREDSKHNVYAIDSASTSEVDDAIGIHFDDEGREWITVYVSDATAYCPYGSELEKSSAGKLTTTTYLPEGVFFMLPKQTVEAATLRDDRACRTFEARFRMCPDSGQILDYYVTVGWCHALRRITYDAVQDLYDDKALSEILLLRSGGNGAEKRGEYKDKILSSTPSWANEHDVKMLHRIHHFAKARLKTRTESKTGVSANLPDPLVKVKSTEVLSVEDQVLGTKDARIAVAELMIAANEVCSRVAQEVNQPIPFRGSRPLSTVHEAALEYLPPPGLMPLAKKKKEGSSKNKEIEVRSPLAEAIFNDISLLRGVTRAVYTHEPLYHNGLGTTNYCHSTSPLRRYPDMLVHHQLKTAIGRQEDIRAFEFIATYEMAQLCNLCSSINVNNRMMQQKSVRFWVLKWLRDHKMGEWKKKHGNDKPFLLTCLVGHTTAVDNCSEVRQPILDPRSIDSNRGGITQSRALKQRSNKCRFTTDVYIPELQITHSIVHNNDEVTAGTTITCYVNQVEPMLDVLVLDIKGVVKADSEQDANAFLVSIGAGAD